MQGLKFKKNFNFYFFSLINLLKINFSIQFKLNFVYQFLHNDFLTNYYSIEQERMSYYFFVLVFNYSKQFVRFESLVWPLIFHSISQQDSKLLNLIDFELIIEFQQNLEWLVQDFKNYFDALNFLTYLKNYDWIHALNEGNYYFINL